MMAWVLEGLVRHHTEIELEMSSEDDLSERQVQIMEYEWVPEYIYQWGKYKDPF